MRNPTNKDKQTKFNKKLKHIHFSTIISVKLVIPEVKKGRQPKTQLVKSLVNTGASESIFTKAKAYKLPVEKTKQELQLSTAAGVLIANTETATSFIFLELHANKLINQSLHLVYLNINRYDIIIGRDLTRSLGIDIHGADMTIHWDYSAIPWCDIDFTRNDVFALSQYNVQLWNQEN